MDEPITGWDLVILCSSVFCMIDSVYHLILVHDYHPWQRGANTQDILIEIMCTIVIEHFNAVPGQSCCCVMMRLLINDVMNSC